MLGRMSGTDWTIVLGFAALVLTGLGVFFGIPTWRMQRHMLAQQEAARTLGITMDDVKRILGGAGADRPRSPDNPSILDALKELRDVTADVAELQAVQGWHMSDGHGPDLADVFRDGFPRWHHDRPHPS